MINTPKVLAMYAHKKSSEMPILREPQEVNIALKILHTLQIYKFIFRFNKETTLLFVVMTKMITMKIIAI